MSSDVANSVAGTSSTRSSAGSRVRLVECGPLLGAKPRLQKTGAGIEGRAETHLGWACTPTGQWVRVLSSTAILANRARDKHRVEGALGLSEFGDVITEFYAAKSGLLPLGLGYERIVYGDHGPYVEFTPEQICWSSFPNFVERPHTCFYDEAFTEDGLTMLYVQKRPVRSRPNPPMGQWSVENHRPEGYADYRVGKIYVAAEADTVAVQRAGAPLGRRRQRGTRGRGRGGGGGKGREAQDEPEECGADPDTVDQKASGEPMEGEVLPSPVGEEWVEVDDWDQWDHWSKGWVKGDWGEAWEQSDWATGNGGGWRSDSWYSGKSWRGVQPDQRKGAQWKPKNETIAEDIQTRTCANDGDSVTELGEVECSIDCDFESNWPSLAQSSATSLDTSVASKTAVRPSVF